MKSASASMGVILLFVAGSATAEPFGADWRKHREEIEEFLAGATVVEIKAIAVGVTKPSRVLLEREGVRAGASWKTFDLVAPRVTLPDGRSEVNFRDSYKHEIAAYVLDRLLGLDLVPPTVVREIDGTKGAIRFWVEGMTEADRLRGRLDVPDAESWLRQMNAVRLFAALIDNMDYRNVANLVVDADFRISAIDLSRGFGVKKRLLAEERLSMVSRAVLDRLRTLQRSTLDESLGEWLTRLQIKMLLKRRDLLVARFEALIALRGEAAVVYD